MTAFVSGKDTFASLPMGYGKSLCYCLQPFVFDSLRRKTNGSIVICVSPLTALMLEERTKYIPRGLATEMMGEAQEDQGVLQQAQDRKYQLVYVSPEAVLGSTHWREMIHSLVHHKNLVIFVIDKAHCVKW